MSDINAIIASIGDAIVLANKQSKEELKAYIKSELGTYKFSGTQIRQNSLPGAAIGRWGVPYTKVSGLQAEVARIAVAEISSATIDYAQISNVRIKTADIDDAAITTAKIGDAAITSAKIGDGEIGTAKIANAAIKTANIDLGAITTALIQEGAVGSVQISDGSITDAKIVGLTANKITAGELAVERLIISGSDKSIVYALNNMGDLVSTAVDTIDGDTLTPRTITADKIVAESITSGEISSEAIITNKIAANAVTADKIAANVITANHISAGAIEADAIDAGAVTTDKLDAESVTAEKIAVGAIKAVHLDAENIFAENAIIKQLMAANIDVDTFFSRDAVINSLTLDRLQPLNDAIEMRFTTEREQTGIYKGITPPADPAVDKLWLDMGVTPSILRRWTGTKWDAVNDLRDDVASAQQSANAALSTLQDISSDNKLTPVEKQEIKREFDAVTAEHQTILSEASQFDVDTTYYSAAYADLHSYVTPLLANLETTSDITGETLRSKFIAYYQTRQGLLGDISIANKQLTENVRDDFLESSVHKSNTPPDNPPVNKLWLDISLSPEQLKRWTGTEWAIVGGSMTDNYIKLGNIKMPDESTEFGIAVGKDVGVLDANGDITTINRSMSVQTAKAFKILTGGEESFAVDATGANAKGFSGETIVLTDINKTGVWVQTTTPTRGFVLKWGG